MCGGEEIEGMNETVRVNGGGEKEKRVLIKRERSIYRMITDFSLQKLVGITRKISIVFLLIL